MVVAVVGVEGGCALAHPAGEVLARPRFVAPGGPAIAAAGLDGGGDRSDQPRVDRKPGLTGGLLDAGLEVFG
jgi:hypothetical protein